MNQLTGVGASDSSDKSKEKAGDQKVSFKTLLCWWNSAALLNDIIDTSKNFADTA